jgi:NAD(P)H-dependent FMN reductase
MERGLSKLLLIVCHSRTGGAWQMAEAAREGAGPADGLRVELGEASRVTAGEVLRSDGFLFACPENLASMSGVMKEFFDRTYYDVLGRIEGRPYATLICAGSDGEGAARQIARIATGWRLRAIAEPLIVRTGAQEADAIRAPKVIGAPELARCQELGATLGAGLAAGIF